MKCQVHMENVQVETHVWRSHHLAHQKEIEVLEILLQLCVVHLCLNLITCTTIYVRFFSICCSFAHIVCTWKSRANREDGWKRTFRAKIHHVVIHVVFKICVEKHVLALIWHISNSKLSVLFSLERFKIKGPSKHKKLRDNKSIMHTMKKQVQFLPNKNRQNKLMITKIIE